MNLFLLAIVLFIQGTPTPPAGVVTGRVLNADGTAAAKIRVSLMPAPEPGTAAAEVPSLSNLAEADNSGSFRIPDVVPGRYYVVAGFLETPTYYPGVRDLSAATVINVRSKAAASGIDFRVAAASGGLKVSGRVVGLETLGTNAPTPVTVSLGGRGAMTATVAPGGSFEIPRVQPGRYTAIISSPLFESGSSTAMIEVADKDLTGVELTVFRLKPVSGTVTIEGRGPIPRLDFALSGMARSQIPRMSISFVIPRSIPTGQNTATFTVTLPEGERRLEPLEGLPPGYAVKSFTYGNIDLTREPLKVTAADTARLHLVLTTSNQLPVKVKGRIVGLDKNDFPAPLRLNMSSPSYSQPFTALAAADGAFEFPEVFPGGYNLWIPGLDFPSTNIPVSVSDTDSTIEVRLPDKKEIRGRLVLEGNGPMPSLALRWSSTPGPNIKATRIDPRADGTFRLALYEGSHTDTNVTLPQGYTLTSITFGSASIGRAPLRISNTESAELEIKVAVSNLRPVKVSGRAAGAASVVLKSPSYAAALNAPVTPDGSFEFPAVLPGNYALFAAGPGIQPNTCAPLVVADTDRKDVDFLVPGAPSADVQILSAIFGGEAGSADVTPVVRKWMKPGYGDLYAAPKWLEADPAVAQPKSLVISYLFRCEEHMLSTIEPWPVNYDFLAQHANPALRRPPSATGDLTILAAYYGSGNQFRTVTPRVEQLVRAGGSFVVSDTTLNINMSGNKVLIVTYAYNGEPSTLVATTNRQFGYDQLVSNAEYEMRTQRTSEPPPWFRNAEPYAPREPGDPGPGFGPSPRKELGIAALMKAVAELKAIETGDMTRDIINVTALVQQAQADAQTNITYPYPAPASKPIVAPVRAAPKAVRLSNAAKALRTAREQLSSAGPGPNEAFLALAIEEIQQALTSLQKLTEPQ